MSSAAISIVLAEDHIVVRQALRTILEKQPHFRVLGDCTDGLEAVQMVEKLKPDILVTDLMIPRLHGLDVIRQVKKFAQKTQIIVLSMQADEPTVTEALHNGAMGYVLKESPAQELVKAINEVYAGRRYLTARVAEFQYREFGERQTQNPEDVADSLTSRERLVLQLAAEGLTSQQISEKLFISPRTAETHRANLMRKLNLTSQTELVRFAIRKGIISA